MDKELARVVAGSDDVLKDVVAYVRQHPQYAELVKALGEKAIQALLAGIGG